MNTYNLISVTAENKSFQSVLANLTKMYCCEWSRYIGTDVDEKGEYLFENYLHYYWERPDRRAFLLQCTYPDGKNAWAGFVLTDRDFIIHDSADNSVAEFFVLPVHRGHGAGSAMAKMIFDMFPGKWELGRNPKNIPSVHFWDKVVSDYSSGKFEITLSCPKHRFVDGTLGDVLYFDNGR